MCIIIAKPAGASLEEEKLRNCFDSNRDGAGFAVSRGKSVYLKKGYFVFEEFWEDVCANITKESTALLHCRIATHGLKDAGNTHPFVVCDNDELLRTTELETSLPVMAHNGVFYKCTPTKDSDLSDTQEFIKKYMNDRALLNGLFTSKVIGQLFADSICTSRVALLGSRNRLKMFGSFEESEGVYYSNGGYSKTYFKPVKVHKSYNSYFDEDDWRKGDVSRYLPPVSTPTPPVCTIPPVRTIGQKGYCQICEEYGETTLIEGLEFCYACANAIRN